MCRSDSECCHDQDLIYVRECIALQNLSGLIIASAEPNFQHSGPRVHGLAEMHIWPHTAKSGPGLRLPIRLCPEISQYQSVDLHGGKVPSEPAHVP